MYIGACGCNCGECRMYPESCKGCYDIKGKAVWLDEVGLEVCDFYDCADNKGHKHCGQCGEIPCEKFYLNKNPKWSDEEHQRIIESRTKLLKGLQ